MMTKSNGVLITEKSTGDAAVDGVLGGVVAGLSSALVLILVALIAGDSPAMVLGRFDPGQSGSPLVGGLLHLATSAVYGIGFAIIYRIINRRWERAHQFAWMLGLLYGLILFLIAELFFLSGFETGLKEFSTVAFAAFHIIYGLTLGLALERSNR